MAKGVITCSNLDRETENWRAAWLEQRLGWPVLKKRFCGDPPLPVARLTPATGHRVFFCPMKKKILLVDDDDAVRRMLGRLLADEDYVVIPASDGCAALKTAAAQGVDLVLLDLNSPAEEVRQTLEEFTRENPHLPVIVTTRSQIPRTTMRGAALMEKPLDFPKLLRTISKLLATA